MKEIIYTTEKNPALMPYTQHSVHIVYYTSVKSTMDVAFDHTKIIDKKPVLILADEQTEGRGRSKPVWHSPKGGLWGTYAIPLTKALSKEQLTFFHYGANISVIRVLKRLYKIEADIKWPNDIFWSNKKLGGILLEYISGNQFFLLVGIGLNTNIRTSDFPSSIRRNVISMQDILKNGISNKELALNIYDQLQSILLLIQNNKFSDIIKEYNKKCTYFKKRLVLDDNNEYFCIGINKEGKLVLEGKKQKVYLKIDDSDTIIMEKNIS